jgi:hypothetical protein
MQQETLIFTAGKQLRKVRFIMWLSFFLAIWAVWAGIDLSRHYGLSPGDGGVLRPQAERLAWGIGVGFLGLAFAVGMDIYGRRYVAQIFASGAEPHTQLRVETLRWWGRHSLIVPASDVTGITQHHGKLNTGDHNVNAPWFFLYLKGRRFPYIVDLQGKFSQPELAQRLLKMRIIIG